MSAAVGFVVGAWSATGFGAALLVGAYIRDRLRASSQAQDEPVLEDLSRAPLEEEVMEQLTFTEALEAKDEILAEVAENHSGWMALAVEKFHQVRDQLPDEFLGEDIRRVLTDNGLPQPKAPHVWGAFVGYLAKKKHIVHTGAWRPMKATGSNGRRSPAYRAAAHREAA